METEKGEGGACTAPSGAPGPRSPFRPFALSALPSEALRLLLLPLLVLLGACGDEAGEATPEVAPDSVLAEALVPLHLAEARAAVAGEDADSLRAAAYAAARRATGLDSAAIAARLRAVARRPEEATALYRRVSDRLDSLRRQAEGRGPESPKTDPGSTSPPQTYPAEHEPRTKDL